MKLKKIIDISFLGLALIAGGMRTHSRLHSKPSQAIEQQLSQDTLYREIIAQNTNPLRREILGIYIDHILPHVLRFGSKITDEQRAYLKTNRIDVSTGKHLKYTSQEQAHLWHFGTDPTHPSIGKDYLLESLQAGAFQKP